MMARETAWRVFAGEYNASTHVLPSFENRAPSYVVSPLGAKINRLFAVGVITDVENIGTESEPMWRARLSDPTGVFFLSAGQYQPEAARTLSKIKPPVFAAVIGKSRTYSPEEGVVYLSIRPEIIKVVDSDTRDYWILETCKSLKKRLEFIEEAEQMSPPTAEKVQALGVSQNLAEGMVTAIENYESRDLSRYRGMLIDSLKYLLPEFQSFSGEEMEEIKTVIGVEEEETSEEAQEKEELLLEIIDSLDKDAKGALWDEIIDTANKKGMNQMAVEETTNQLLEKGLIYEPVLGRIKRS